MYAGRRAWFHWPAASISFDDAWIDEHCRAGLGVIDRSASGCGWSLYGGPAQIFDNSRFRIRARRSMVDLSGSRWCDGSPRSPLGLEIASACQAEGSIFQVLRVKSRYRITSNIPPEREAIIGHIILPSRVAACVMTKYKPNPMPASRGNFKSER